MIKRLLITIVILFSISMPLAAHAQTPTKKTSVTPTKKDSLIDDISDLKDRIASRVAELNLVDNRGIIGTVRNVSDTRITIEDLQNNTRVIDVDEFTKFSSPSAKGNFGISDITSGSPVGAIGKYNKDSKKLLARFVDVITLPVFIHGHVYEIDDEEFMLRVMQEDQKSVSVDVETSTRTSTYLDGEVTRAGFSKIQLGTRIHIFGYPDKKNPGRVIASRILLFPNLPRNPRITLPDDVIDSENAPVSTGSGKKLTPVR